MGELEKTGAIISNSEENRELMQYKDKCDRCDYLVAVACGAVGGLIDIFLIGSPGNSIAGSWADAEVDKVVMNFARLDGWRPKEAQKNSIASAIGFLERRYKVNYDQRHTAEVGGLFPMSTKNHHMKSLSHAPDIVGLFFSVLNQFTSTSTFIADGQLITIQTKTYELQGGNFIAKIFCGIVNWFGHIMSDIAGSSGSSIRGTGVVIPFYELFQFCRFGNFQVGKARQDLATIAVRAFQEGYDMRFGLASALPVIVTELSIRLIWSLRRYFQFHMPLKECIPSQKHDDLRVMLLFGNGTLCIMDAIDAGLRSGGNFLAFFMRLNLLAWFRFVTLVLKEVCIRAGIKDAFQRQIEAFQRINEALLEYLHELEQIDMEAFKRETEEYNQIIRTFKEIETDQEWNTALVEIYDRMGWNKPWEGDFDKHMSDKDATLVFD